MRPYDPALPLISIHIPKCAGSSLVDVLRHWFAGPRLRMHYRPAGTPSLHGASDGLPPRHALSAGMCVHGHFNGARGFGVWDYYPEASQFITFVREPFDRFVSQWLHMHRRRKDGERVPELDDEPSFDTWLHRRAEQQRKGCNSYSPVWFLPSPPGAEPAQTHFERDYVFVGVFERLAASMCGLAAALGQAQMELPHLNATARPAQDFEQWRVFFERHFADECALYQTACEHHLRQTGV